MSGYSTGRNSKTFTVHYEYTDHVIEYSGSGQNRSAYSRPVTRQGSKTITVNIEGYVDTTSFESSVANCCQNVDNLTGSVVAMNSATCLEVSKTGDEVAESIGRGFGKLISYEISQQMAELKAYLEATEGELLNYSKALQNCRKRMEEDYHRISSRYMEIFNGLDKSLENRLKRLDAHVFEADKTCGELLDNYTSSISGAASMVSSQNAANAQNALQSANIRSQSLGSINSIRNLVRDEINFESNLEKSMHSQINGEQKIFMPVVYQNSNSEETKFYFPQFAESDVKKQISRVIENNTETLLEEKIEDESIDAFFFKKLNDGLNSVDSTNPINKRIFETLNQLWNNNK